MTVLHLSTMTLSQICTVLSAHPPDEATIRAMEGDYRVGVRVLAARERKRLRREEQERHRLRQMLRFEQELWEEGIVHVAGVDEAGRGPLAGPVVAAAVILPRDVALPGVKDSKKLTAQEREERYGQIRQTAQAITIGSVDNREIDRTNILRASLRAMRKAIERLPIPPDRVLVDGSHVPGSCFPERAIVDGDARSLSIAAASVIAKVTRDRWMAKYDRVYPAYGFAQHKGYGTPEHLAALHTHGPCPIHRRSFRMARAETVAWSEDFQTFREGVEAAQASEDLLAIGRAIRRTKGGLQDEELAELRRLYRARQRVLKKDDRKQTGNQGESVAESMLREKGYRIVERNYRTAGGEIDLIVQDRRTLVFVEVKTGRNEEFGSPETWVTPVKRKQIAKVARGYLAAQPVRDVDIRFDVVAIERRGTNQHIRHIENAFWVEG